MTSQIGPSLPPLPDIGKLIREQNEWTFGFANVIFEQLQRQVLDFEAGLNPDQEVLALIASFGRTVEVLIDTISYRKPYLLVISGTAVGTGEKVRLVQHVSQTNLLFRAVQKPDVSRPARRIGFSHSTPADPPVSGRSAV